jgi:hypothetical protein
MREANRLRHGHVWRTFKTKFGTLGMFVPRSEVMLGNLVTLTEYLKSGEAEVKSVIKL